MKTSIYTLKDTLERVDAPDNWSQGTFTCFSCRKTCSDGKFSTRIGSLCSACVERELRKLSRGSTILAWSREQILEALDPASGKIRERLFVLWRFHEALPKFTTDIETLRTLLVRNLGFAEAHPLGPVVRKSALQVCVTIGASFVPLLFEQIQGASGIFAENITTVLQRIAPDDPDVQTVIKQAESAASSVEPPQPASDKQQRLQSVLNHLDPSLRSFVKLGIATDPRTQSVTTKTGEAPAYEPIQLTTKREKHLEKLISKAYHPEALKKIYLTYLHGSVFDESLLRHRRKRSELIRALAKVFASRELFLALYTRCSPAIQAIFQLLIWEGQEYEAGHLETMFNIGIMNPEETYYRGEPQDIAPALLLFPLRIHYNWQGAYSSSHTYYFSFSRELRDHFKRYLPMPADYELIPLATIEATDYRYEDQDRILEQIKLYAAYVTEGNLKFSENSGKLLKSSLSRMAKFCQIQEFYDSSVKTLRYTKTQLLIDFLYGKQIEPPPSPAVFLHMIFADFFEAPRQPGVDLYEYLPYLRGWQNLSGGGRDQQRERKVRQALYELLQALPQGQWVSLDNIVKYCLSHDVYLDVVDRGTQSDLYFNQKTDRSVGSKYERISARGAYYKESVIVPFLKTMMALFGTFGLVDLAYDVPVNPFFQYQEQAYLSVFDGVRYVRVTPLGSYVIGKADRYGSPIKEDSARIVLDTQRLFITIEGRDPIKTMEIQQIAEQVNERCYKVSYASFLQHCATQRDIHQRIDAFYKHLAADPPPNWHTFLTEVVEKINPLSKREDLTVFQLKDQQNLISLIVRDPNLKKYILKAEDYHILAATRDIPKIRKRLEAFGYFIDNM